MAAHGSSSLQDSSHWGLTPQLQIPSAPPPPATQRHHLLHAARPELTMSTLRFLLHVLVAGSELPPPKSLWTISWAHGFCRTFLPPPKWRTHSELGSKKRGGLASPPRPSAPPGGRGSFLASSVPPLSPLAPQAEQAPATCQQHGEQGSRGSGLHGASLLWALPRMGPWGQGDGTSVLHAWSSQIGEGCSQGARWKRVTRGQDCGGEPAGTGGPEKPGSGGEENPGRRRGHGERGAGATGRSRDEADELRGPVLSREQKLRVTSHDSCWEMAQGLGHPGP